MVTITLLGKPKSTQHCYKSTTRNGYNRTYMTQDAINLKESYQWQAKTQFKGTPTAEPLRVRMYIYHQTKRKCDIDNFNKLCFDALTGIVWQDDNQISELTITKSYDKDNPRIILDIYEQIHL